MKYYIICGEASGDLHASNLIKVLAQKDTSATFRGICGDLSKNQGLELLHHYSIYAFMGFLEVIKHINTIRKGLRKVVEDILVWKPDVLILIDYPGFNLRIAKQAKKHGIKVVYYISPKIWAWNTSRVHRIKRDVDLMLSILPFEVDFYGAYQMHVVYVGNPLYDSIQAFKQDKDFRLKVGLTSSDKILAVLPGSRQQEVKNIYPIAIKAAEQFCVSHNGYKIVVATAPGFQANDFNELYTSSAVLFTNQTYDLLAIANGALVTSGTAVLEAAMFKVPQLALYKTSAVSYLIAKMLIKVKYITLPNLILNKPFVKELIQDQCTGDNLLLNLHQLISASDSTTFDKETSILLEKLKPLYASANAADEILKFLHVK